MSTQAYEYSVKEVFRNIIEPAYEIAVAHPTEVADFYKVVEYRSFTPGFPEYSLPDSSRISAIFDSMLLSLPAEKWFSDGCVIIHRIPSMGSNVSKSFSSRKKLAAALTHDLLSCRVCGERRIWRFLSNIRKTNLHPGQHILGLMADYIERRDNIPY